MAGQLTTARRFGWIDARRGPAGWRQGSGKPVDEMMLCRQRLKGFGSGWLILVVPWPDFRRFQGSWAPGASLADMGIGIDDCTALIWASLQFQLPLQLAELMTASLGCARQLSSNGNTG
ncbi:hypothetical protein EJB05_46107, partial [Eragrostis curvula]